jgi:phosphoserine aminotransferase
MFAIQMAAMVFDWIAEQGGLSAMAEPAQGGNRLWRD